MPKYRETQRQNLSRNRGRGTARTDAVGFFQKIDNRFVDEIIRSSAIRKRALTEDTDWTDVPLGFRVVWRQDGDAGDAALVAERMKRLAPRAALRRAA
ncbi:MAG: hypothetical protein EOP60_04150 [Sphingomonadales bacterium]|nr:MAG: hypothetical protein EOP60_04150 [Sphingomonadales bacterium]